MMSRVRVPALPSPAQHVSIVLPGGHSCAVLECALPQAWTGHQVVVRRRYGSGRRFRWSGGASDVRVIRIVLAMT